MMLTWQQYLAMAASHFSHDLADEAIGDIRQMGATLEGADEQQKMFALASVARLLEEHGRVTEAIAYYEELVELALTIDPEDIRTARDLSLLARLYHRIGALELESRVLERAQMIYGNLPTRWLGMLEPGELDSFHLRLEQSRALLALDENLRQSLSSNTEIIKRIAAVLRNGFSKLVAEPQSIVQEIHNALVPFSESSLVRAVTNALRSYLLEQKRSWMELALITGPGAEGWRQRQSVVRTSFPDEIRRCASMHDGMLVVFSSDGRTWTAQVGEQPVEIALSSAPRAGEYALRSLGKSLALIDERGTLRFFRYCDGVFTDINAEQHSALLLASAGERFVALFSDGSLATFDEAGSCHGRVWHACEEPGHVYQMHAMDNSQAVWLVEALPSGGLGRSRLRKVHFDPPGVDPAMEIPLTVRGVCQSFGEDRLWIGSLDGLREWKIGDPFPEKADGGSAGQMIRSSDGRYTAMFWNGVRVMQSANGLHAKIPLPGATGIADQLLLDESANPPLLHVVVANQVETWGLDKLLWRPRDVALECWVEKAIFSDDGSELVAISPVGVRYLWKVETGALVEFENFDPKVRMISWAPDHSFGAICEEDAVEIFDRNQVEVTRIPDMRPYGATWSSDGSRLAWTRCMGPLIRWAERTGGSFQEHLISGKPDTNSLSPSLSPDGRALAFVSSRFRIPTLPEEGVSGRIAWPGALAHSLFPIRGKFADPIMLIDLQTGNVLREVPGLGCWWTSVWWLSNRYLFAGDDNCRAAILDRETGELIASCWTDEPATGGRLVAGCFRLCDTGFSAAVGPVVYDFWIYRNGEPLLWD
jgi:tetratricopeptide (TPR) repeat protein